MTAVPDWPSVQKVLVCLLHFYLQGLLMGISSNMTIFLGFLAWRFILFDTASLFFFILFFFHTPCPLAFFSPLPAFPATLIWWWAIARYRRKKKKSCNMKPRSQCHKSRINGEQSTGCSLRTHFFASRMLLLFFPSCDIYFSFLHTSDLRAAGLRSVVRKTTDLSVILSCLIWKNVGYFLFLLAICDKKFFNYRLTPFI